MQRTTYNFRNYRYNQKVSYRSSNKRWLALVLSILVIFGSEYSFDIPQSMETAIEEKLEIDTVTFNLLYSLYSFPNLILPLFGGIFIDLLGVRVGLLVFSFAIIIGQIVCAVGGYFSYFWLILVGRIMFGIGAESLYIAQNAIVSLWFQNKELAFALGINLSIPRMASGINSLVTPRVVNETNNLFPPFAVGAGICFVSWICAFILVYMDRESDKREGKIKKEDKDSLKASLLGSGDLKAEAVTSKDPKESGNSQQNNQTPGSSDPNQSLVLSNNLDYKENLEPILNQLKKNRKEQNSKDENPNQKPEDEESEGERVRWADIKKLKASFWIIVLLCALSEGLFVPFLDNSNKFYQYRFSFTSETAGNILLIPYFFSGIISPLIGILIDKLGKRRTFIFLTTIAYLATHLLLAFLPNCDSECYVTVLPLFLLGLSFCLYNSAMVASVPLVVDNKIIGTAFGLVVMFQNATLAVFPLIVGAIFEDVNNDSTKVESEREGFLYSSCFFIGISILSVVLAVALLLFDKTMNKALDSVKDTQEEGFQRFDERSKKQVTFKESMAAHLMDIKEDEEFEDLEILNKYEWKHSPTMREALGLDRSGIFPLFSSLNNDRKKK